MSQKQKQQKQYRPEPRPTLASVTPGEAEAALLALAVNDIAAVVAILEKEGIKLDESHFYYKAHKIMYRLLLAMHGSGKYGDKITAAMFVDELKRTESMMTPDEQVVAKEEARKAQQPADKRVDADSYFDDGFNYRYNANDEGRVDPDFVSMLIGKGGGGEAGDAPHYAKIVLEGEKRRDLLAGLAKMQRAAYEKLTGQGDPVMVGRAVLDAAFKINDNARSSLPGGEAVKFVDKAKEIWNIAAGMAPPRREALGMGFDPLDEYMGGMNGGNFGIIAARPGLGKTSLAIYIASKATAAFRDVNDKAEPGADPASARKTLPTIFFASAEMSADEIVVKMLSMGTGEDQKDIKNGTLDAKGLEAVGQLLDDMQHQEFFIDETPRIYIEDLCFRAMSRWREGMENGCPLRLIVVDYLQLLRAEPTRYGKSFWANRNEEVSAISGELKELARKLDVPIIALAQVNRAQEGRVSKQHTLSDLRESGALEQDADWVIFIERKEDKHEGYDENSARRDIMLWIAKNRHGPAGKRFKAIYLPARNQFIMNDQKGEYSDGG